MGTKPRSPELEEFVAELRAFGDPALRDKCRTFAAITKTQMGAGYELNMEELVRDFQASLKEVIDRQRG